MVLGKKDGKDEVAQGTPPSKPQDPVPEEKREIIGRAVSEAERFLTKARDILKLGMPTEKEVSKAELKRLFMACKRASQDLESELKAMRRVL
jgi:hypothetical protein